MTDFQTLRNIEKFEMLFQAAKELAVSLGAKQESFAEAEAKLKEVKDEFLKRVSGGIVADFAEKNSQVAAVKNETAPGVGTQIIEH